jgi:DNA-directed RNA polymerase sigma subunit (sigma70/sigma32)
LGVEYISPQNEYGFGIALIRRGQEMDDTEIVSVERLTEGASTLLNQLASARRDIILLRHRLQSIGRLTPSAIADLDRADEEFRVSIERVRTICDLQADTVTKLKSLDQGDA